MRLLQFILFYCFIFLSFADAKAQQFCGTVKPAKHHFSTEKNADPPCPLMWECWGYGHNSCEDINVVGCPHRIPLAFHIVTETDGTGGVDESSIDDDLVLLNLAAGLNGLNVEFYECEPRRYINNSALYSIGINEDTLLIAESFVPNVINVYTVGDVIDLSAFSNFPGDEDAIVVENQSIGLGVSGHELGHYFGLLHTHEDYFYKENPGNTIYSIDYCDCAPDFIGDGISDTPPDPNLSTNCPGPDCYVNAACNPNFGPGEGPSVYITNCNNNTISTVNMGDYSPLLNNFMSYVGDAACLPFYLTACQNNKMIQVLRSCRNYLCDASPLGYLADTAQARISICAGDSLPPISAINECYEWFDAPTAGTLLFEGEHFQAPTSGTGAIDTSVPGIYHYYVASGNQINPDCRLKIEIEVLADNEDACYSCELNIPLKTGWNLISSNCIPDEAMMDSVFFDIRSDVIQVKDLGGLYIPSLNHNSIGDWDIKKGYLVKVSNDINLTIRGNNRLDLTTEYIPLSTGCHLMAYWLDTTSIDVETVFESIENSMISVKDLDGVYVPALQTNTMDSIVIGTGLKIKMQAVDTLYYGY